MIRRREFLHRNRRRIALLAVLGALALAVVLEHSGVEHSQMGSGEIGPVVSMCLAIAVVGSGMVGALAVARVRRVERPPLTIDAGPVLLLAAPTREAAPPRAGPSVLQVFRR